MLPNIEYVRNTIIPKLRTIVFEVRDILAQNYNVVDKNSSNYNYMGLCDVACAMIKERIDEEFKDSEIQVTCNYIHGEQKHTSRIRSLYWPVQHTWLDVVIGPKVIYHVYIDPTVQQFRRLYNFSRAVYIEMCPPEWYYPDKDNPSFTPMGKWINENFFIRHKVFREGFGMMSTRDGIIEYFQYEVWGTISDIIWYLREKKRKKQCIKQGIKYKEIGGRL